MCIRDRNSIPHKGERRARNPIDMICPSFLGAAANPATNPPKIEVHKVQIYCSLGNPGTPGTLLFQDKFLLN